MKRYIIIEKLLKKYEVTVFMLTFYKSVNNSTTVLSDMKSTEQEGMSAFLVTYGIETANRVPSGSVKSLK